MDDTQRHIGDYLARIPYAVGYELADDHVVVSAIRADQRTTAHMVLGWDDNIPVAQVADQIAHALSRAEQPENVMVVGYGPDGAGRARDLADRLRHATSSLVVPLRVRDGMWQALAGEPTDEQPIPDPAAELVVAGLPVPAASRAQLEASVTPLPAPAFTPLDEATAGRLAALTPRQRAELAQDLLERVAQEHQDGTAQMRVLGHLAATDLVTRDVVLAHTLDGTIRHDRVEALVRTFRAAPPEQRPMLATLAAAATFFACWHVPKVRGILSNADPLAHLTDLVASALEANLDPRQAHDTVRNGAAEELRRSEQEHATAPDNTPDRSPGPDAACHGRAGRTDPRADPPTRPDQNGPSL